MEYIEGGNLSQKLAGRPLPAKESAELVAVIARAVESAHQGGVVHRDLKPANILLSRDGVPKISDFGLARRVNIDATLTMTGARLGTPNYMAPEQLVGGSKCIAPAFDVYALGAVLYEMLVGRPPFHSDSISEIERRLANEDPPSPSRENLKVPRDLETICLKCLQKDPAQRYHSAGDLADDLDRFLHHEPIRARPVGRAERFTRWVRRNPTIAALVATALALCGLLVVEAAKELALAAGRRTEKAVGAPLVAALDDWAMCTSDTRRRNWLLEVARLADPDPTGWRDRARDPTTWDDHDTLAMLAKSAAGTKSNMQLLRALGDRLDDAGLDSILFRKQVIREHTDDYIANWPC